MTLRPKLEIVFAALAESDIDDIIAYTLETFGEIQLAAYKKVLAEAFAMLQQHLEIGRIHNSLPQKHRSYQAGKHVIFYRIKGRQIVVVRVLHERKHFANHF